MFGETRNCIQRARKYAAFSAAGKRVRVGVRKANGRINPSPYPVGSFSNSDPAYPENLLWAGAERRMAQGAVQHVMGAVLGDRT